MNIAALPECMVVVGYAQPKEMPERDPRPRGRPRTRTLDHYQRLLLECQRVSAWFVETHGREAKSDKELLSAYFRANYQERGLRASRVSLPEFRSKLKTLRNELSIARRLLSGCPEKSSFTGTTGTPN